MSGKYQVQPAQKLTEKTQKRLPSLEQAVEPLVEAMPVHASPQRALKAPHLMRQRDRAYLQRTIGNRELARPGANKLWPSVIQRQDGGWTPPRVIGYVRAKRKHIHFSKGEMGHWWTEIRTFQGEESYGWWPRSQGTLTDALIGTRGELNAVSLGIGGTRTRDPYHGDPAEESMIPVTDNKQKSDAQIIADMRRFAHSYRGSWRWSLGGTDCHTFQEKLLDAAGLRLPSLRESIWMTLTPAPSREPSRVSGRASVPSRPASINRKSNDKGIQLMPVKKQNVIPYFVQARANQSELISTASLTSFIYRKCSCGKTILGGAECEECRQKHPRIQRATGSQPKEISFKNLNRQSRPIYSSKRLQHTHPNTAQRVSTPVVAGAAAGLVIGAVSFKAALDYAKSLSTRYPGWLSVLPDCPCRIDEVRKNRSLWEGDRNPLLGYFHPGAAKSFRSKSGFSSVPDSSHGQQCTYDVHGDLITDGPGAGTPDIWSPNTNQGKHTLYDVATWQVLGWRIYNQYWRPNNGNHCPTCRGENTLSRRISEFLP